MREYVDFEITLAGAEESEPRDTNFLPARLPTTVRADASYACERCKAVTSHIEWDIPVEQMKQLNASAVQGGDVGVLALGALAEIRPAGGGPSPPLLWEVSRRRLGPQRDDTGRRGRITVGRKVRVATVDASSVVRGREVQSDVPTFPTRPAGLTLDTFADDGGDRRMSRMNEFHTIAVPRGRG